MNPSYVLKQHDSAWLLDRVRFVESIGMIILAPLFLTVGPVGYVLAASLVGSGIILFPRKRERSASREETRLTTITTLIDEAYKLRRDYLVAREDLILQEHGETFMEVGKGIVEWIESATDRLRPYPEFRRIFQASESTGGLLNEIDVRIGRLAEIKRLAEMSRRLSLPI
jgi:hypothetical protein